MYNVSNPNPNHSPTSTPDTNLNANSKTNHNPNTNLNIVSKCGNEDVHELFSKNENYGGVTNIVNVDYILIQSASHSNDKDTVNKKVVITLTHSITLTDSI
jgi:hypothetical protein